MAAKRKPAPRKPKLQSTSTLKTLSINRKGEPVLSKGRPMGDRSNKVRQSPRTGGFTRPFNLYP